jgi:hypothetical protein
MHQLSSSESVAIYGSREMYEDRLKEIVEDSNDWGGTEEIMLLIHLFSAHSLPIEICTWQCTNNVSQPVQHENYFDFHSILVKLTPPSTPSSPPALLSPLGICHLMYCTVKDNEGGNAYHWNLISGVPATKTGFQQMIFNYQQRMKIESVVRDQCVKWMIEKYERKSSSEAVAGSVKEKQQQQAVSSSQQVSPDPTSASVGIPSENNSNQSNQIAQQANGKSERRESSSTILNSQHINTNTTASACASSSSQVHIYTLGLYTTYIHYIYIYIYHIYTTYISIPNPCSFYSIIHHMYMSVYCVLGGQ